MTAPLDPIRTELAEALLHTSLHSPHPPNSGAMALEQADALLPTVARLRAEAAAEALEQFSVSLAERRAIFTASRGSYRKASQLAWDSAQTRRAAALSAVTSPEPS